ncbi:MAG: dTDP-glucose 4,6-dehydratase [Candidatus Omnitrophica bacterium]|nr:dTDP-glucose 4,6-dehydratase [Candidatus Omnitrophota bacterium]
MRRGLSKILITGGAGFIGSEFVRLLVSLREAVSAGNFPWQSLVVIDKLTYAGDLSRLKKAANKIKFYRVDICDKKRIDGIFAKEKPDAVVNFAAETHVDRSIRDARIFLETNIIGTSVLLDTALKYKTERFLHISTDEVYGEIKKGEFTEDSPFKPSSPYAASKAAADLLVKSYIRTYGVPAIIIRPCNNYGPWQYPEKLIPLSVLKVLKGQKIPVYADGRNVREWLFVGDCARGILHILNKGSIGQVYNLGSGQERPNIEAVKLLLKILGAQERMIQFVRDRPGHDARYKLDSRKVRRQTGWRPKTDFREGMRDTVGWCVKNKKWLLSKWQNIAGLYRK